LDLPSKEESLGLFGFNAEKKLAKGQEQLAKGHYYEARLTFEEILVHDNVEAGIIGQAKDGRRKVRLALIDLQKGEADQYLRAGEIPQALDCWRAIVDLAGDELDSTEAKAMLAKYGGEKGPHAKILEGLDAVAPVATLPAEDEGEEEYFGDDPEEIFEVYLQTLPDEQAEAYRALGGPFREGYLLIQQGNAAEALEHFASADGDALKSPYLHLESAQALLLSNQNERALQTIDSIEPPKEVRRRVAEMRAILLERLGRGEEAESEALRVWEEGKDADAALLYAEILLDHQQFDRALDVLKPFVHPSRPQAEIDRLAAKAYAGLGRIEDVRNLLERAVETFFQGPVGIRDAPAFPLWAARDLLDLYTAVGEAPEKVRSLAQHLIRHDPDAGEVYRGALSAYVRKLEEADRAD
jgi:tetratricopeptide (TPR) repeat protein